MNTVPHSTAQAAVGAVLAFLQVLAGATALSDLTPPEVHGWVILLVAALQAAWVYWMQNTNTPNEEVAAHTSPDHDGTVLAGPATDHPTGIQVEVVEADQTPGHQA